MIHSSETQEVSIESNQDSNAGETTTTMDHLQLCPPTFIKSAEFSGKAEQRVYCGDKCTIVFWKPCEE
jgi:hypothetical protein